MQKVSKAYKESMKSSLRERAYIMISFGLVNQEAQAKATVDNGSYAYYSNKDNIFGEHIDDTVYATLEEEFTKVDGSMFFLPRATEGGRYYDTGIVSDKLVSEARCEVIISLNTIATDFKGLTINFGENYPVDFDIVGSTGQTIEFRGNTKSKWSTEEVLENTTYIKLVFYKMKNPQSRLRIYSIMFGYGLVYYNDSVMSSSLDSYVSPIGADVPQFDFSVTLKNYDHYFNVDNPNSAINYLETGQEMDIMYGYQTPGSDTIEWIQGNHLWCSEWESDDNTATIRCQDIFRNMDGEYVKGLYSAAGKSYYALAEEILKDAGISEYYIDPRLKKLYSNNPIPRVKYKEALQIIANACRCVLTQSRDGKVQIKSNFMPSASIATNGEETYSNAANVLTDTPKVEYATLAGNYTPTDGTMFFLPRNGKAALTTGYVSKEISGANGTFTKNPVVTITMEAIRAYYGLKLVFGTALPAAFTIRTYKGGEPVNEYPVEKDEINTTSIILRDFDDFDVMKIEFTKTAEPYNRIVLNYFSLSDVVDFTMNRRDMTSSPKAIKQELIKEVIVPWLLRKTVERSRIDVSYMSDEEYEHCLDRLFDSLLYQYMNPKLFTGEKFMGKHLNIGDQVAQTAGISYRIRIDNYVKIVRGVKFYAGYMDDSYAIHESKEFLQELLEDIIEIANELGITVNTRKTRICKLSEHWRFLQVQYSLTDTGRVIQKINPKRLTAMRRKMKKLAPKLTEKEFTDFYKSWFKNHYKIMSKKQRSNMDTLRFTLH